MKIITNLLGIGDAETSYVVPSDLYDQMLALSDRRKAGEDVDAECRELVKVLYERRKELGAIIQFRSSGISVHVGVRQ